MEEGRARKHAASFSSDGEQSGVEKGEREEEVAKERYGDIERGGGIAINERVCGRESEREKRRPLIPLSPTPSKRPRTAAAQAPTHSTPPLHIRPQRRRSTAEREREREREKERESVSNKTKSKARSRRRRALPLGVLAGVRALPRAVLCGTVHRQQCKCRRQNSRTRERHGKRVSGRDN